MGTFYEKVVIYNPEEPSKNLELGLVVDSGATYTWIPKDILSSLDIKPTSKRKLKIATGAIIERDVAWIKMDLKGEIGATLCIFGDEGSEPLLGAFTLEGFGLGIDPVNKTLVPVISLLLSVSPTRFHCSFHHYQLPHKS